MSKINGTTDLKNERHILIGWDDSPQGNRALIYGIETAFAMNIENIVIIHVQPRVKMNFSPLGGAALSNRLRQRYQEMCSRDRLDELIGQYDHLNIDFTRLDSIGEIGPQIVKAGKYAEMIIVGSHGYSVVDRFMLGSVSEYVLRHAEVPVLIHRTEDDNLPKRIVLATDCSKEVDTAQEYAIELAKDFNAEMLVLSTCPMPLVGLAPGAGDVAMMQAHATVIERMREANDNLQNELMDIDGIDIVEGEVDTGHITTLLGKRIERGDLVVLGRAERPWPLPIGPGKVAEFCVRKLQANVLVAPLRK